MSPFRVLIFSILISGTFSCRMHEASPDGSRQPVHWTQTSTEDFSSSVVEGLDFHRSPDEVKLFEGSGGDGHRMPYSVDEHTVALWHFDEQGGARVPDASPHGHHGTITETSPFGAGKYGNALELKSGAVLVPDSPHLSGLKQGTIEVWIQLETLDTYPVILRKGEGGDEGTEYFLQITRDGKVEAQFGSAYGYFGKPGTVRAGLWTHVAMVFDGQSLVVFVNGERIQLKIRGEPPTAIKVPLVIGRQSRETGGHNTRGLIDELRISSVPRQSFLFSPDSLGNLYSPPINFDQQFLFSPTVDWDASTPADSKLEVYLSDDGGANWTEVSKRGQVLQNVPVVSQLHLRAKLTRATSGESPVLRSWSLRAEAESLESLVRARCSGSGKTFNIVQITDTHTSTSDTRHFVAEINQLSPRPEFVIHTGDITNDGRAEEYEVMRKEIVELEVPYYPARGNHEPDRDECLRYFKHFLDERFRDHPETYYSFDKHGWHFVTLDNGMQYVSRKSPVDQKQLDWLDRDLQANSNKPTILFFHCHVLPAPNVEWLNTIAAVDRGNRTALFELLANHPQVRWALNGHTHYDFLWKYRGVHVVTTPPVCGWSFDPKNPTGGHPSPSHPAYQGYRIFHFEGERLILSVSKSRDGNTRLDPKPEDFPEFVDTTGWFEDPSPR